MVMDASLCIGLDCDRSGPDFLCSDARVIDRRLTKHTRRLRGIRIKLVAFDHPYAIVLPSIRMFMLIFTHGFTPWRGSEMAQMLSSMLDQSQFSVKSVFPWILMAVFVENVSTWSRSFEIVVQSIIFHIT